MDTIKMSKDELENLLSGVASKAVDARVKELEATKTTNKFGGQISITDEKIASMSKFEKAAEFIKAVFRKDVGALATIKQMNETTGADGGFIVPEEWSAEVVRVVEDFGLVAKLARRYPMRYDTLRIPRLGSSVTATYVGELGVIPATQPVFEEIVLLTKTLAGITGMSNELLQDANVDVVNLLTDLFAEAIAGELDEQGLVGTGAPFTGILNAAGTNVVVSSGATFALAATADDCRDLISEVKPWSLQGGAFIMHRTIWSIIQKSKSSTGGDYFASAANPILTPNGATQGFPSAVVGTLWGYPVYLSDKMPDITASAASTKFIIFGNLKHLYLGMRKDISVAISDSATVDGNNLFEQNMSAVRVLTRNAVAVGLPSAFAVLETAP